LIGLAAVGGLSAANSSPDADGHGGTLITDPSVARSPLCETVSWMTIVRHIV
jgi:hypothetical protein